MFPGLALAAMVRQTELSAVGVWLGAQSIEAILVATFGLAWLRCGIGRRLNRLVGWTLLALGASWFAYRWFV